MSSDNLTYINPTTRQFPKRPNPLARVGVAPGFYLTDAGTVAPIPTPEARQSRADVKKVTR